MKLILKEKNKYVIRLDRGEEVIEGIEVFCQKHKIRAGFFYCIGAAQKVSLSHYDVNAKKYSDKIIQQKLEIISLLGNVAKMSGQILIHAHGIFSDKNMRALAGHVKKLVVAATCEIFMESLKGKIERRYDQTIGLNLME